MKLKDPAKRGTARSLEALPGPELVFALVGAAGTDLSKVGELLCAQLKKVGYESIEVRPSDLLHQLDRYRRKTKRPFPSEFERIKAHMEAGSALRADTGRGDALAMLSVARIRQLRQERSNDGSEDSALFRKAFIIRSLKHPAEIQLTTAN